MHLTGGIRTAKKDIVLQASVEMSMGLYSSDQIYSNSQTYFDYVDVILREADNFLEYDSKELINEKKDLSDRIPIFSVKYPPEWEYGWFGDDGLIALLISSVNPSDAFFGRDESGAIIMIVPVPYSGEELTDLFFTILNGWHRYSGLESYTTTINGQDAAWAEYTDEDSLYIEVVIVQAEWALPIVAHFPVEKETEFRPLIETTISTIEIK